MGATATHDNPPPRKRSRALRALLWTLAIVALLAAIAIGAVLWLFNTSAGARFALDRAAAALGEGTRFEGVQGRLGGELRIDLIEISDAERYIRVEDVVLDTEPLSPLGGTLQVNRLKAGSVEVRTVDTGAAATIPASFEPPYPVNLDRGEVGVLRMGDLTKEAAAEKDAARKRQLMNASRDNDLVLRDIFLKGQGTGREWRIAEARVAHELGRASVSGRIGTNPPFDLDVTATAEGKAAERPYTAKVETKGKLERIEANLQATVSGQPATGSAVIEPFAKVPVRSLKAQARDVDLAKHAEGPKTRLAIEVELAGAEGNAFAGPVRVTNAEPGPWDRQRLPLESATARVAVRGARVEVTDLAAKLSGGASAAGRVTIQESGVNADLRVEALDLAALHTELQPTQATGRVAIAGDADRQRFELDVTDPRFAVEGRAVLAGQRLDVESLRVGTRGGSVTATGYFGLDDPQPFRFEGRARNFDPSAFAKTAKGDLNFTFTASGSIAGTPSGEADVTIAPSTFAGLKASGRVFARGNPERIERADADVTLGEARLTAKGSFGRAGDAMDVTFRIPNLSTIARPLGVAAGGRLEGEGRLAGTFRSPSGRLSMKGANLALPTNVFVQELSLTAQAGADPSSRIEAEVRARGVAVGEERPPTTLAERVVVTAAGTRADHRIELEAQMARDATARVALVGGTDPRAARPTWQGRLQALSLTGRGAFQLASPAPLFISPERVELGEATLRGLWGEARLTTTRWTPRSLDLKGSSPGIEIQNVARSLRLDVRRSSLVLAMDWDIRAHENLDGTLNLRRVSGDLRMGEPPLPMGLSELTLDAKVNRGAARAELRLAGERVGRLEGTGTATIARGKTGWELAPQAPVDARLVATHTNLAVLAPWLGPDARLGGRLNAVVRVTGTGADPQLSGEARAEALAVREPQTGFEIEDGLVAVKLAGSTLTIDQFRARAPWRPSKRALAGMDKIEVPAGGGTISAEGSADLKALRGDLRVKVEKVPVTQLATRFVAVSGEASLSTTPGEAASLASGRFKVDAGWVGALETAPPAPSEDIVVVRAAQPAPPEPEEAGAPIRVDLRVGLGDNLHFEGRGLDTRLAGDIHLTGTVGAGGLRANGTIRTVGGTYKGYGQELTIERGELIFNGSLENPRFSILALRKGLPVEAGVEVTGSMVRPRVRLVSRPEVPEPEKLSWLVLGRGAADASLGDTAVMMAAARALLGGDAPGEGLTKKLGFDEVKIGRASSNSILGVLPQSTVAGRTGTPAASEVVSVGKRITDDVHLTYEQGLADAEGALKVAWQISRKFQVLVRAGFLPGLDVVYRWTFE